MTGNRKFIQMLVCSGLLMAFAVLAGFQDWDPERVVDLAAWLGLYLGVFSGANILEHREKTKQNKSDNES